MTLAAQHLTYVEMEMLGLLPADPGLVSFCVVRNPYDRTLSSVMHFSKAEWKSFDNGDDRCAGFERDLEAWLSRPLSDHNLRAHRRSQLDFVRDRRGEIAVEHILRFESLREDFYALGVRLGWNALDIGRVGDSGRRRAYRDFYTDRSRRLVEDCFGEDCAAFEYQY